MTTWCGEKREMVPMSEGRIIFQFEANVQCIFILAHTDMKIDTYQNDSWAYYSCGSSNKG